MERRHALAEVPTPLWRMVALARHRLLMLDYDGTLAPFVVARDEARPLPRSLELVRRIADSAHTSVAIVSGRPLAEVEQLMGVLPVFLVGEHGWEQRGPDGVIVRPPLRPLVAAKIDAAERVARESGWGEHVERKRSAVVLHTRGLPAASARELQDRCFEAWKLLAVGGHVALDRIHGGVEFRAHGRNKGTVVASLISQAEPGTLGVFVGDDVTDEDAFDAVREQGFGVRVGDDGMPSNAQGRLASCTSVPEFLSEWLRVTEVSAPGAV